MLGTVRDICKIHPMVHDYRRRSRQRCRQSGRQAGVLSASLSRAVGAHTGLTQAEIIEYLATPYRKADEYLAALERLRDRAWYLHRESEAFYFKETENLGRRIERDAKQIPPPTTGS